MNLSFSICFLCYSNLHVFTATESVLSIMMFSIPIHIPTVPKEMKDSYFKHKVIFDENRSRKVFSILNAAKTDKNPS
jgi:hypothetical protein